MSDPAVEAAQRVNEEATYSYAVEVDGITHEYALKRVARAAAREALVPLRELHRPMDEDEGRGPHWPREYCAACTHEDDGVWMAWPCATARLIYSSAELEGHTP